MKRLTKRRPSGIIYVDFTEKESAMSRLASVEDILGDEYELDRLRELVEADREQEFQRHLKRFDIMPPKKSAMKAREQE